MMTMVVKLVVDNNIQKKPKDGGQEVSMGSGQLHALLSSDSSTLYVLALALAVITLWVAHAIYKSKLGTGLFAIHDDEDVAEVMGVPTLRYKLIAFGVSCGLAGIAGGIHAMFLSDVTVGAAFSS